MDVNQKEKLKRVVITLGVLGGFLIVIMLGLYLSGKQGEPRIPSHQRVQEVSTFSVPGNRLDPAQVWLTQSETQLSDLNRQNQQQARELEQLKKMVDELQTKQREQAQTQGRSSSTLSSNPVEYPAEPLPAPRQLPAPGGLSIERALPSFTQSVTQGVMDDVRRAQGQESSQPPAPAGGILSLSISQPAPDSTGASEVGKTPARTIENFLPASAFIGVTLLSGANAPTGGQAQSNPIPIMLQLDDDGSLPNAFTSRVRDCRVTTAAYGDLPSERAYLRTEKLVCINHDGQVLETALRGYVSGEDGMAGMRGPVVEKRGQFIALSLLSGTLGGIGSGLSQGLTNLSTNALGSVQTVDPKDALEYGAWTGVGNTLEKLADWYLKRADELYPVIEIHAGRYGHVVLTDGLNLDIDLWQQQEQGDEL